jgi:hypothetical protein
LPSSPNKTSFKSPRHSLSLPSVKPLITTLNASLSPKNHPSACDSRIAHTASFRCRQVASGVAHHPRSEPRSTATTFNRPAFAPGPSHIIDCEPTSHPQTCQHGSERRWPTLSNGDHRLQTRTQALPDSCALTALAAAITHQRRGQSYSVLPWREWQQPCAAA